MAVFNGMFPIQAGKEEDARAFAAETIGARLDGYAAHHKRAGTTRETWSLQETPWGASCSCGSKAIRRRRSATS